MDVRGTTQSWHFHCKAFRVPPLFLPLIMLFDEYGERWTTLKLLANSTAKMRSQEAIAAAGGRSNFDGPVKEQWWAEDDAREAQLFVKVENLYKKALQECKVDFNLMIPSPTLARTLVLTTSRLIRSKARQIKRKARRKRGGGSSAT